MLTVCSYLFNTKNLGVGKPITSDKIKDYMLEKETNDPSYINHILDHFLFY